MNDAEAWSAHLDGLGAIRAGHAVVGFERPTGGGAPPGASERLCDLGHYGLVTVRGADARALLQGQLTADVEHLDAGRSTLAAWCNPKGRVLACMRLLRIPDGYLLHLPRDLAARTLARLRLYVLRADVQLHDASDDAARVGVFGPGAAALLEASLGEAPGAPGAVAVHGECTVVRHPGEVPRFEVIGPFDAIAGLWDALSRACLASGAGEWTLHEIRAGVPDVESATAEAYLPQMLNLDLLDGVSFTKGCYLGQEVVARTQHLGRLKRRMYRASVDAGDPPRPGDPLYVSDGDGSQAAGAVVRAAPAPEGGFEVLAVIQVDAARRGGLRLRHVLGEEIALLDLPYDVALPAEARAGT